MAYTMVNLRADAIEEARRLGCARTVLRNGDREALDRLEGDATWIVMSRRGRLRRALRPRVCLIWRTTFEDASGHVLESHVVPVLLHVAKFGGSAWAEEIESLLRARVDTETLRWRAEVARVNAAFASTRFARAQAIAADAAAPLAPSQPGLFDRRFQRQQHDHGFAAAADEAALAERRDRIAAARAVPMAARLLLVLVP
jgi:hypothetical protein